MLGLLGLQRRRMEDHKGVKMRADASIIERLLGR